MSELSLTIRELYDRVWTTPVDRLAAEFGLSGRGLGKLCAHHNIPVPPRGWWAKKAAGKRVRQDSLPPLPTDDKKTIFLESRPQPNPPPDDQALPPEIAFERDPVNAIVVDENARISHPLVRDAAKELRSRSADMNGIVQTPAGCVDVRVSKVSISRAMRILDALLVALERRQYRVVVKDGKTIVTVLGEPFRISLKEHHRQTIRELTADEHRRRREGSHVNPYELKPSGDLALHIGDSYTSKAVGDRKKQRLEDLLNLVVEKLVTEALAEKARRAQRAREEEERLKAEERRNVEKNRSRHEVAKRDRFDDLVRFRRLHGERRVFLPALRDAVGEVPTDSPLGKWLAWADDYVALADPLQRFRNRTETIKLYHLAYSWTADRIESEGFHDPDPPPPYSQEKASPPGILLRDRPSGGGGETALELELPEDLVLPFEVTQPGFAPRTFYVPAEVLNARLKTVAPAPGPLRDGR